MINKKNPMNYYHHIKFLFDFQFFSLKRKKITNKTHLIYIFTYKNYTIIFFVFLSTNQKELGSLKITQIKNSTIK